MTVFCPNCGKPNTDEATKCAACGNDLKKGGAKKFRGTMMMSTPPVSKPPGAPSSPGSLPVPPGTPPVATPPAAAPSVPPVNKNIAFQKTMMGTPPAGTGPSSSAPPPAAGSSAPPPRPRQGTLLGTAPMSPNPQAFGAPPGASEPKPPFGAPPAAAPVPVQPMGQPTAPAGSFGEAPAGPTGGSFGQPPASTGGFAPSPAASSGGFGQPPAAGGFGVPGGQFGGSDDPAKKKKLLLFGGIGCLVLILLCCVTGYVVYSHLKQAALSAQTDGASGDDNSMAGVTAELARIPLTFVLTQILSQCKSDPSGAAIKPFFHPQVFDRLHAEACTLDENAITVFRDTDATKVTNLMALPEASMAKDLGLDAGTCFLFDAGKGARIITCRDESNATKIIHLEGIAQLRAQ